jgi:coproporphyrinogen III oxidase-like Fe-S oxidoreductase
MPVDDLLLVGLRRREGVPLPRLLAQAGLTAVAATRALESLRFALQPWLQAGLLLEEGPRWRLSDPSGLAVSNAVLRCLLGWWADQDFSGWPANCAALPEPGSAPGATGG